VFRNVVVAIGFFSNEYQFQAIYCPRQVPEKEFPLAPPFKWISSTGDMDCDSFRYPVTKYFRPIG
jgi:hypothetical protein